MLFQADFSSDVNSSVIFKLKNHQPSNLAKYIDCLCHGNVLYDLGPKRMYRIILDSMQSNSRMMDKRLLGIFNKKQYNFYVELCSGLSLTPLYVDGLVNENYTRGIKALKEVLFLSQIDAG